VRLHNQATDAFWQIQGKMVLMRKPALFALTLLGLFDSAYLLWVYTSPSSPMICLGGGTGCDTVRASSYAHLFGVPLPAFGVLMYVSAALLVFAESLVSARLAELIRQAVAVIAGAAFLFSLYLTGIEAFVLHAWCTWCMMSAGCITLIFALALWMALRPGPAPEPVAALAQLRRHFAVFVAGLALGVPGFYFLVRAHTLPPVPVASPEALLQRLVRPDSHATGNLQSPVTIVEFGDFQCTPCEVAEPAVRKIRAQFGSRIRFVFRHFPMPSIHPWAEQAAEASECAAEQGKFWEAAEKFYQRQTDLSRAGLGRYATELGLDTNRFAACLDSKATTARVNRDLEDARALGLRATPTFFIGRRIVEGPLPYEQFAQLVQQELTLAGAPAAPATAPAAVASGTSPASSKPSTPAAAMPVVTPGVPSVPSTTGSGLFGNRSGGILTQIETAGAGCSEAEAAAQQPPLLRTAEARQLFEADPKVLFVDVRSASEFSAGHIPHALNVPANEIEPRRASLPKDKTIIFYEGGKNPGDVCGLSRNAARYLLAHGFTPEHVKVYQDGLAGWEQAGLPVER
jgi:protein-disulfide isomerase/rhodanese-related sulfurtransferase/uncharacterized membrane protein